MKTKNLFKIIAVLSPMVFATTFSVNALATPIESLDSKPTVELLERVNPKLTSKTRIEMTQINPDGTKSPIVTTKRLLEDRSELQKQMDLEAAAEIKKQSLADMDTFSIGITPISLIEDDSEVQEEYTFSDLLDTSKDIEVDGRAIADLQAPVADDSKLDGRDVSNDGEISILVQPELEESEVQLNTEEVANQLIETLAIEEEVVTSSAEEEVVTSSADEEVVTSSAEEEVAEVEIVEVQEEVTEVEIVEVQEEVAEVVTSSADGMISSLAGAPAQARGEYGSTEGIITIEETNDEVAEVEIVEVQEEVAEVEIVEAQEEVAEVEIVEVQEEVAEVVTSSADGMISSLAGAPAQARGEFGSTEGVVTVQDSNVEASEVEVVEVQEQEELEGPSPAAELSDAMGIASQDLISSLPTDVETLVESTQEITETTVDADALTEEEVSQALTEVNTAEADATEIANALTLTPESPEKTEIETKLEKALADLEAAKKSLTEKEDKIAEQKKDFDEKLETQATEFADFKEETNKAYCEREDQFAALTAKIEALQNNDVNKIQETMMAMMMPMYMNMMANQGPRVQNGFDNNFAKNFFGQNNGGQQYGLNMLSLSDLFNSRSTGGMNYNVYNIGGDYVGGNFSSNPIAGGVTNAQQFRYNENPMSQFAANQDPMRPFSFNFANNSTLDSNRFEQLNNQSSFAHRDQIESNIRNMSEGRNIFNNTPRTQQPQIRPSTNGQMST
jgi:hypothetical protein